MMNEKIKKSKRTFREYYLIFLAITLLIYGGYTMLNSSDVRDYSSTIFDADPSYVEIEEIKSNPLIFKVFRSSGEVDLATITNSVGYQSKLELLTIIDEKGLITKVDVLEQGETPAFFDKILQSKFTDRFVGKTTFEPIYVGRAKGYPGSSEGVMTQNQVDAVSGSTISSVAIAEAVNKGTTYVASNYFEKNVHSPFIQMNITLSEIGLLVIFIIAALSLYIKGINRYRKFVLLYSVLVVGFYLNRFFTFGMIQSFFSGNWPLANNISWYLLTFGTFAMIILLGRNMYCSWICPFGAMQEVILKFGGLKPIKLTPGLVKVFRLIQPTLAYIAIMLMLYTNEIQTLAYDPFSAVFNLTALPIMWMCLPILIFVSLVQYRFYCTYFCPIGFILNGMTKIRSKGVELWRKMKATA